MGKFTSYQTLAKRFGKLGVEQNEYKESYMVFSEFLLGIKDSNIDIAYVPYEYTVDVQNCYNAIKTVAIKYSTTLGESLQKCPQQMKEGLEDIEMLLGPAIEAAERLSKGESSDELEDWFKIKKMLAVCADFAKTYSERCDEIAGDITAFKENELQEIQTNISNLVSNMIKSSDTYEECKENLKKEIEKLQDMAKQYTNTAIGLGIGVGVFMALGACVVGMALTGGTAAGLIALAAVGIPCLIGGSVVAVLGIEAAEVQKQIDAITAQMSDYDKSIAQVDIYADTYNNMLNQIDEVQKALVTMGEEWEILGEEFNKLVSMVDNGQKSFDNEDWKAVYNIVKDIQGELGILSKEIDKVDISGTTVVKAELTCGMTEEEYKSACETAEQVPLLKYLRTA